MSRKAIKNHHKHVKQRRKIALIAMIIGIICVLISAAISLVFIKPTNFKSEYRQRELQDCLETTTAPDVCQEKFGS